MCVRARPRASVLLALARPLWRWSDYPPLVRHRVGALRQTMEMTAAAMAALRAHCRKALLESARGWSRQLVGMPLFMRLAQMGPRPAPHHNTLNGGLRAGACRGWRAQNRRGRSFECAGCGVVLLHVAQPPTLGREPARLSQRVTATCLHGCARSTQNRPRADGAGVQPHRPRRARHVGVAHRFGPRLWPAAPGSPSAPRGARCPPTPRPLSALSADDCGDRGRQRLRQTVVAGSCAPQPCAVATPSPDDR